MLLLSKKEAADFMRISTKTLERKTFGDGAIDYYKIGKRIFYDKIDILSFMQTCRHRAKRIGET